MICKYRVRRDCPDPYFFPNSVPIPPDPITQERANVQLLITIEIGVKSKFLQWFRSKDMSILSFLAIECVVFRSADTFSLSTGEGDNSNVSFNICFPYIEYVSFTF